MNKSQSTYFYIKYVGQKVGHMMSKSEEKLWDIDIKNSTVSPLKKLSVLHMHIRNFLTKCLWLLCVEALEQNECHELCVRLGRQMAKC